MEHRDDVERFNLGLRYDGFTDGYGRQLINASLLMAYVLKTEVGPFVMQILLP